MANVLVPIDGLRGNTRIVARAIDLYRSSPVDIHLLSVQPPYNRHVAGFFSAAELRRYHEEDGMRELEAPRRQLAAADVPHTLHIEIGRHADTISRVARELGCRHVLMRDATQGFALQFVLGSLASQVQRLLADYSTTCDVI